MPKSSKFDEYSRKRLQVLIDHSDSISEVLVRVGLVPKGGNFKTFWRKVEEYDLDVGEFNKRRKERQRELARQQNESRKKPLEDYLVRGQDFKAHIRRRLFSEGVLEKKCDNCDIEKWLGGELSFHIHHKNGDSSDNRLENLEVLCPNCHSQTEGFAGQSSHSSTCNECGGHASYSADVCIDCYSPPPGNLEGRREDRYDWPDSSRLEYLIWSMPITAIADKIGCSDVAVKKKCKKWDIETPPRGYWLREENKDWDK